MCNTHKIDPSRTESLIATSVAMGGSGGDKGIIARIGV